MEASMVDDSELLLPIFMRGKDNRETIHSPSSERRAVISNQLGSDAPLFRVRSNQQSCPSGRAPTAVQKTSGVHHQERNKKESCGEKPQEAQKRIIKNGTTLRSRRLETVDYQGSFFVLERILCRFVPFWILQIA